MEFVGLTVPQALAAFAVAAGVVTALYLLKLRRRPVQVAYLALWSEVLTEARTSELFSRLTRWGSWLASLLFAALVVGALSDPRPPRGERTLHVLLVDASLSMQATEGGSTRFSLAVEQAQAYVDRLAEGDAAMVITLAAHPSAEPITTEPAALQRALASIEVTDTEADVTRALELAFDATLGQRPAQVVLFTDGAVTVPPALLRRMDEAGLSLHAVPIEESAAAPASAPSNFAITALAARPHPLDASRAEVLLEVESFADREAEIEVRLDTEGRAIEVLRLTLPPRERVRRFFTDVSGLDRTLEAHLSVVSGPEDRLPGDDHGYTRIAERSRTRVAVVSRDNAYLEAALLLDEALEVTDIPASAVPDPAAVDVAIFDGIVPEVAYAGPAIYLRPDARTGGASPLVVTGEVERPRFDVLEDDHPLLRWASLRNVNVARALSFELGEGDAVVAGDEGVPLLVVGEREGFRFVALSFDVRDSDLPLRIAWPVLLLDAIGYLTPNEEREVSFARAGEPFSMALPAGATEARLVRAGSIAGRGSSPDSGWPVASLDGFARLEVDFAGVHRLETDVGERLVAVSPARGSESDLRALGPIVVDDVGPALSAPSTSAPRPARHLAEWLALAAVAFLLIEGLSYHRRWTV